MLRTTKQIENKKKHNNNNDLIQEIKKKNAKIIGTLNEKTFK
jgi:hypothetical protein